MEEGKTATTRLASRVSPGEAVILRLPNGDEIRIEFGNGRRLARENVFYLPRDVKFSKSKFD